MLVIVLLDFLYEFFSKRQKQIKKTETRDYYRHKDTVLLRSP
jgi:hypothetical protein